MARNRYRGPTDICPKHQRRYELYRGCGECEAEKPRAPGPSEAELAERKKRSEWIRGVLERAITGNGGADGEG